MSEVRTIDDNILAEVRMNLEAFGGERPPVTFIAEPAVEPLFCPIISVDDHALEPADAFVSRVAAKHRDAVPRLESDDDGLAWWIIDGTPSPVTLVNGAAGRPMTEWGTYPSRFEDFPAGVRDPVARLHDMDITGVWASLCFSSTVWGFAGTRFSRFRDPEVGLVALRAYNDWMVDEWCGADRDRFIPCQLPWLCDPHAAATEIYRNAERGFRAVSFSENPAALGFPSVYDPYWDPFFGACAETQTVVNLHVGSSGTTRKLTADSHPLVTTALFPLSGIEAFIDWTFSGVFARHPALVVALSEAGVSWVPMAFERLRRAERQSGAVGRRSVRRSAGAPSLLEMAREHFVFTSIEDDAAFLQLDLIGEDKVMIECDYPHFDTTWPESQAMVEHECAHLAPATVRKVCFENAARIYRHPPPPPDIIARSKVGLPR